MPKQFDIQKFNKILLECNQQLQAISITGQEVILSNGLELKTKDTVARCKKRVMKGNSVWKNNFDRLYSINHTKRKAAEAECRSVISRKGGNRCWDIHKERIKQNLNTGVPWNKDLKGKYPYSHSCSEEAKRKIGQANRGKNNGMYGTKMSSEQKEFLSKQMKQKILSGKFTPNSNNRNTHWDSFYKNKKYRSSWEALYQSFDQQAEYETVRIPYWHNNKEHIYIVDFVNHTSKTLIEVKPCELLLDKRTQDKFAAARAWCASNNYQFVIVDKEYLTTKQMPEDLFEFDSKTQQKIRKMYETS